MKFLSDGTWFDKGTEVEILVECCTVYDGETGKPTLSVLAKGLRNGGIDEEMCAMDEFYIVGDDYTGIETKKLDMYNERGYW